MNALYKNVLCFLVLLLNCSLACMSLPRLVHASEIIFPEEPLMEPSPKVKRLCRTQSIPVIRMGWSSLKVKDFIPVSCAMIFYFSNNLIIFDIKIVIYILSRLSFLTVKKPCFTIKKISLTLRSLTLHCNHCRLIFSSQPVAQKSAARSVMRTLTYLLLKV